MDRWIAKAKEIPEIGLINTSDTCGKIHRSRLFYFGPVDAMSDPLKSRCTSSLGSLNL